MLSVLIFIIVFMAYVLCSSEKRNTPMILSYFSCMYSACFQVKVNSSEPFRFEPISEKSNCRNSETVFEFAACAVQVFWKPETSTETSISIKQYGEDICFKIQPFKTEPYAVSVKRESKWTSFQFRLQIDGYCQHYWTYHLVCKKLGIFLWYFI